MSVGTKEALIESHKQIRDSTYAYWLNAMGEIRAMVGSDTDLIDTRDIKAKAYMTLAGLPEEVRQRCHEAAKEHLGDLNEDNLTRLFDEYPSGSIRARPMRMTEYGSADNDIAEAEIRATYRVEQQLIADCAIGAPMSMALERRYQATIAHKDEVIAGLQDEINFLKAREAATEIAEKRALFERDKAIEALKNSDIGKLRQERADWRNRAIAAEAERDKHKEDSDLRATAIHALLQAKNETRKQAKPDNSKGAQLAHAIGNAGESMSKQGLSLFDRYY